MPSLADHVEATDRLVRRRRRQRDDVTEPRGVPHLARLPDRNAARAATRRLLAAGFTIDLLERDRRGVRLHFSSWGPIDEASARAFTHAAFEAVTAARGTYWGWRANWLNDDLSLGLEHARVMRSVA